METNQLLASTRSTFVLIARPTDPKKFWASQLPGLSSDHIAQATGELRTKHASTSTTLSKDLSLKSSALQKSFARALGVKDQHAWQKVLAEELPQFMDQHGLRIPADLINPPNHRDLMIKLDPRKVADRIFNSAHPRPSRIYTGIGGKRFQYSVHSQFVESVKNRMLGPRSDYTSSAHFRDAIHKRSADKVFGAHESELAHEFYRTLPDSKEVLMSPEEFLQLTLRDVLLAGGELYFQAGEMLHTLVTRHRLLCAGVMGPLQEDATRNDGSPALFSILREALADDTGGWVEVLPFNSHLCFLKGTDGRFDWVVRDQRNELLSTSPLYPILDAKELPSDSKHSFSVWHYYQTGRSFHDDHLAAWGWQHKHGDLLKGERQPINIIEQWLRDAGTYRVVARPHARPLHSTKHPIFYDERVGSIPLKVSELITAEQFLEFVRAENWLQKRAERAAKAKINLDSIEPQLCDLDLPAGVTFYDAMAYCGWLEDQFGVPVRLLSPLEWQSALPRELKERHHARLHTPLDREVRPVTVRMTTDTLRAERTLKREQRPTDRVVGCEFEGRLIAHEGLPWLDQDGYQAVPVRFVRENVVWARNDAGVPFLDGRGFGEWLNNLSHGHAPAVCASYGRTLTDGEIHSADHAIRGTYKHHGCKIGFRVCYVQSLDS